MKKKFGCLALLFALCSLALTGCVGVVVRERPGVVVVHRRPVVLHRHYRPCPPPPPAPHYHRHRR